MKQRWRLVGAVLVALGCDPGATNTLRLTPSPAAQPDSVRANALAAVERLALRFGLTAVPGGYDRCTSFWRLPGDRRRDPPRRGGADLVVCVVPLAAGAIEVQVGEIRGWSPRGDSLRRALTDTLAGFGTLQVVRAP